MNSSWGEWVALTATERKVGFFLVGAFLAGLGIRLYKEAVPAEQNFDYRSSDSTFAALSTAAENRENQGGRPENGGLLNINTASKDQLIQLPGIGDVTAERIILYREDVGPFMSIEDLGKVKGISKQKLEKLKPLITVH